MIEFLKRRWVYHSIIWIVSYLTLTVLTFIAEGNAASFYSCFVEPLSFVIPVMITCYLSFWAKSKLFDSRKYLQYFIAFIVIVVIGVAAYEAIEMLDASVGNSRTQNVVNFVFIQVFVVGLQYFKRGIVSQFQLQELRAKTVMTELNALKAQINPHFLFNTLNNIYGMNQINSEKGSEMIMELSDVMRYHLEFSKVEKVKLQDEIQLLKSYIKLEQLRLRETCDAQVDFENADESIRISPLLFIPFVENAFKHGTHPTRECFVHIQLRTTSDRLYFTVKNSIIADRKVVKTNIGLHNTDLSITKNDVYHLVELSIEL